MTAGWAVVANGCNENIAPEGIIGENKNGETIAFNGINFCITGENAFAEIDGVLGTELKTGSTRGGGTMTEGSGVSLRAAFRGGGVNNGSSTLASVGVVVRSSLSSTSELEFGDLAPAGEAD